MGMRISDFGLRISDLGELASHATDGDSNHGMLSNGRLLIPTASSGGSDIFELRNSDLEIGSFCRVGVSSQGMVGSGHLLILAASSRRPKKLRISDLGVRS